MKKITPAFCIFGGDILYQVMIVDDREIFRRCFKRFSVFEDNSDFQVLFEAQNGKEALHLLENEKIDLLITDIRMPIMDGIELLQAVRERKLCRCVVLLSEYEDFAYAKSGISLGAFEYCVKPMDEEQLKVLLKKVKGYLDEEGNDRISAIPETKILPEMVIRNDSNTKRTVHRILMLIAEKKKEERHRFIICIWDSLVKEIFAEKPVLKEYLFIPDLRDSLNQNPEHRFSEEVENLRRTVGKLLIATKNPLILSVCETVLAEVENGISLAAAAERFYVNKAYLSHLFKAETELSFVEYVTGVKMQRAKRLLYDKRNRVYEVAAKLGYEDTEYFSRIFKEYEGVTPTIFRKELCQETMSGDYDMREGDGNAVGQKENNL